MDGRFGEALRSEFFHPSLGLLWSTSTADRPSGVPKPVLFVAADAAALEVGIAAMFGEPRDEVGQRRRTVIRRVAESAGVACQQLSAPRE